MRPLETKPIDLAHCRRLPMEEGIEYAGNTKRPAGWGPLLITAGFVLLIFAGAFGAIVSATLAAPTPECARVLP